MTEHGREEYMREGVGAFLSSALWIFIDLWFVWPEWHAGAWWFGIGYLIFQCIERTTLLSSRRAELGIAIILAAGTVGHFLIPRTPRPESENHFWVETGNEPVPKVFGGMSVGPNDLIVEFGNDFAMKTDRDYFSAVTFPCTKIILERTPEGAAAITTIVRDEQGRIAARIIQNEIRLMPWENDWSQSSGGHSTVGVLDSYGKRVFVLKSKNSQMVQFDGIFFCEGKKYTVGFPSGVSGPDGPTVDHLGITGRVTGGVTVLP